MTYANQQRNQFKTLIYEGELNQLAGWVEEYPNLETGGDLFGFWTHSGNPVVQFVLGPGKDSRHYPRSFYQDRDLLIKTGKLLRDNHGLQHIGEWHSHHQMGLAEPSSGDQRTVFNALRTYNFPRFLLCITNLRSEAKTHCLNKYDVNIGCFLFTDTDQYQRYQVGSWVVLPDQSPIREKEVNNERNLILFSSDNPRKNWNVKETKLEEEPLVTTEPIKISQEVWYSTEQGKALLKEIFEGLDRCRYFQKFEMRRNSTTEEIYFNLESNYERNYDKWQISFPNSFPKSSPSIKVNSFEPAVIKDWKGKSRQFDQIKDYIQRYYDGKRR